MSTRQTWIVGSAAECDVRVPLATVSSRHCRLSRTSDGFLIEDLGSTNGTYVNGRRIEGPTPLTHADRVTLGSQTPFPWPDEVAVLSDQATLIPDSGVAALQANTPLEPSPAAASTSADATMIPEDRGGWVPPAGTLPPVSPTARVIRIGRALDNDVAIDRPMVSGHHARLLIEGDEITLEDLGSANGTAVGAPSNRIERAMVGSDDIVYLGSYKVPMARLLGLPGSDEHTLDTVAIGSQSIVFGRDRSCDQVLDFPMISRRHARATRTSRGLTIEDLGSSNGTFVNGQPIREPVDVRPGDIIRLGSYTFTLTPGLALEKRDYRGDVTIEAKGIAVDVPGRRLIEDVSLTIYPTEFVGLMGPSGSGKTTLLNALNGYVRPTGGSVLLNGQDMYENYDQFRGQIGYVPQDDIIHGDLTVGQALYYTARLRLPADFSDDDIRDRIRKVLEQLGLEGTESVLIGSPDKKGISGGQRKRVNLAMELLTDPSILFLDEPTSGLSSEDTINVMKLLRDLANGGKTILLTIHQPSLEAFRLMDNLVVVAKDRGSPQPGRLAYYGPTYPDSVQFFNPTNKSGTGPRAPSGPEEVLRGLSRGTADHWVNRYASSNYHHQFIESRAGNVLAQPRSETKPRRKWSQALSQWLTLTSRAARIKWRDTWNSIILLSQAPIIAGLVVMAFGGALKRPINSFESWFAATSAVAITSFLLALAGIWFGCSNAAREIVAERAIYFRERMVNLRIPAYVGSKFLVLGGISIVQCVLLLVVVHVGVGLTGSWLPMFGILVLSSLVGLAIGLCVSALSRTSEQAVGMLPLILIPMIILGGVLQTLEQMSPTVRVLSNGMPSRWAFESMELLETEHRPAMEAAGVPAMQISLVKRHPQDDMAERFFATGKTRTSVGTGALALGGMLVLLVGVILGALRLRDVH